MPSAPPARPRRKSAQHAAQTHLALFTPGERRLRPTGIVEPVAFEYQASPPAMEGTWSPYIPRAVAVNAAPHPTPLLVPSCQRALNTPVPDVPVMLDRGLIDQRILSREQLDLIARGLTTHTRFHINEKGERIRLGLLVGFGTGSGKTSVAIGLAEATRNGNVSAPPCVIVTSSQLIAGVFREQGEDLGVPPERFFPLKHANLESLGRIDLRKTPYLLMTYAIFRRWIGGTVEQAQAHLTTHRSAPYATLLHNAIQSALDKRESRVALRLVDVLRTILPEDTLFAFDECDELRNPKSDQGAALKTIDEGMPLARIIYLSATPIPEARSFAYLANRLGLAGSPAIFLTASDAAEAAHLDTRMAELLVAEGVSLGTIASGGLSFEGVTYSTITTRTTDAQRAVLDYYASIINHGLMYARARLERYKNLTYDIARFPVPTSSQLTVLANLAMKQILMDLARPALFAAIDEARARGESVIIEVARTGESARKSAVAQGTAQAESSGKHAIAELIRLLSLPVNVRTIEIGEQRVLIDRNPERTAETTSNLERAMRAVVEDDHVLTDLATRYGSRFAEITGRDVRTERIGGKLVTTPRNAVKENRNAIADLAAGNIDIVAVSEAGSRGIDLHAGASFANQSQRTLLVFDPFVSPAEFQQMLGRVCRTGQVSWPKVAFFTTDMPALSANLGTVVAKMREAGACTYGERDSLRVNADTLLIDNVGFDIVTHLLLALERDPLLNAYRGSHKFSGRATLSGLVQWGATLPSCDRLPVQQRFWHFLSTIAENATLQTVDTRVYRNDRQVARETTIQGLPATIIDVEEPDQFVRSWTSVAKAVFDADARWFTTAEGVTCAYPLPRFGMNDQAYRILQPRGARVEYALPLGTELSFEAARDAWHKAINDIPRRRRRMLVAAFPIGRLVQLDRELARSNGKGIELDDGYITAHTHTFLDRSGGSVFGLYLTHARRSGLGLDPGSADGIAS